MKNLLIGAVAASLTGIAGQAAAADLPMKAPIAPAAMTYSWTGFYVGVNGGYGWKDSGVSYTANDPLVLGTFNILGATTIIPPASFTNKGAIGGGQIGYNWQFDRNWLAGIEADIDAAAVKGTGASNTILHFAGVVAPFAVAANQKVDWFGTVRARLGWLPTDRLLVFATGGFAYGDVKESVALTTAANVIGVNGGVAYACIAGTPCFVGALSGTRTGWTAGAGVEYAFWQNFSVKAEYLYVNLGGGDNVKVTAVNSGPINASASFTASYSGVSFNVVRASVNYKF